MDTAKLRNKVLKIMVAAPVVMGLFFFPAAGTLDYPQAWIFMATIMVPVVFVILYFLKNDPEFLERRLRMKERETRQGLIIKFGLLVFGVGFLLPGLDRRFGWSSVPIEISLAADLAVLAGYAAVIWVFMENSYAGRTVEVEKGQKVVSTGPYYVIRHPMYLGTLVMYLAVPVALGSYATVPVFLLYIPLIVARILSEEEILRRELPGYAEYCKKTRYRLIPFIW